MSRLDGKLTAAGKASVELADILAALGQRPNARHEERRHAIACYLSADQGWRDASRRLDGAFARSEADSRVKPEKDA